MGTKQILDKGVSEINFFLPMRDDTKAKYRLIITSDTWIMEPEC